MADVKFMDLSQNDNPATTDSVLIGNSTDGLKRTTIGAIGNVLAVKGLFHLETLGLHSEADPKQTTPHTNRMVVIEAPNVTGYTFLFWLSTATLGAITSNYIEKPYLNKTNVFITFPDDYFKELPFEVSATAVYVKSSVA